MLSGFPPQAGLCLVRSKRQPEQPTQLSIVKGPDWEKINKQSLLHLSDFGVDFLPTYDSALSLPSIGHLPGQGRRLLSRILGANTLPSVSLALDLELGPGLTPRRRPHRPTLPLRHRYRLCLRLFLAVPSCRASRLPKPLSFRRFLRPSITHSGTLACLPLSP